MPRFSVATALAQPKSRSNTSVLHQVAVLMASRLKSTQETVRPLPTDAYTREGDGLEFERVSFFSDAVYAIAMTLLVVELGVPMLSGSTANPQTMLIALSEKVTEIVSFFLGFILIGRYWLAHHQFWSALRAVDQRLIGINLVYLAFVAFLPFPVALIGNYEENPISFLFFALCMALISAMEVVMFAYAAQKGLTRRPVSPEVYRYGLIGSGAPVVIFVLSMPIAFINTTLALACWLVMIPWGAWLHRRAPKDLDDYLLAGSSKGDE